MTPTPITLLDNNMDLHSDNVMRSRWDGRELDHKAVGSHLPLGKRNSTPVGCGVGVGNPYSPLKVTMPQHQQIVGSLPSPTLDGSNLHRSLDRSQSEPLRNQLSASGSAAAGSSSSSRYKTELCRPFGETGFCKYGEKCQFAHGCSELRNMPRHPKYKTELCRTFHTTGLCGYGTRCHFIHNAEERRSPSSHSSHSPVSPTSSLGLPFSMRSQDDDINGHSLGPSPPASLHGSPTASSGTFFDDSFSLVSSAPSSDDLLPYSMLGLETPPVSPVESLAGDMDSLSLSPALSDSPSPPHSALGSFSNGMASNVASLNALMDSARYLRLPIFETLTEVL